MSSSGPGAGAVLDALLDVPDVRVLRVELSGSLLGDVHGYTGLAGRAVIEVQAATDDDAHALVDRWGLSEEPSSLTYETARGGEYLHRRWFGTARTPAGRARVLVRTCRYLPPARAAISAAPTPPTVAVA